jgi:hypothetical protein
MTFVDSETKTKTRKAKTTQRDKDRQSKDKTKQNKPIRTPTAKFNTRQDNHIQIHCVRKRMEKDEWLIYQESFLFMQNIGRKQYKM